MKLLASSSTIEGIEKMINLYFYSTTYKVTKIDTLYEIRSRLGLLKNFTVLFKNKRFKFYEL